MDNEQKNIFEFVFISFVALVVFSTLLFLMNHFFLGQFLGVDAFEIIPQLIAYLFMFLVCIFLTKKINDLNNAKPEWQVAIYVGGMVFCAHFFYKLMKRFILHDVSWQSIFHFNLANAFWLGLLGFMISNLTIHRIRGKKDLVPLILLISLLVIFNLL